VTAEQRLVLLFDGTCGPCTRLADFVRHRDHAGRILVLPNQAPGALGRYGVNRADADRSAWLIEPGGRRLEGAAAITRALEALGGGWRLLAVPGRARAVAAAEEVAYRWVARNRRHLAWLGVIPECERPGAPCSD
jgi:predicted DCC family thiol-disulfide oxidoreductase YuxK